MRDEWFPKIHEYLHGFFSTWHYFTTENINMRSHVPQRLLRRTSGFGSLKRNHIAIIWHFLWHDFCCLQFCCDYWCFYGLTNKNHKAEWYDKLDFPQVAYY